MTLPGGGAHFFSGVAPLYLVHSRRTQPASSPLLQTSVARVRPQDRLSPPRTTREQGTGRVVLANKRWGRGGRRCHLPYGPQALGSQNVYGYNPRGGHGAVGISNATARV
jgi:hypothetical protein